MGNIAVKLFNLMCKHRIHNPNGYLTTYLLTYSMEQSPS